MSRQEVARYVAAHLKEGRPSAIEHAAAWLIDSGRSRQASYLASDVAKIMASEGYVYARVTTSSPLDAALTADIREYLVQNVGAKEIELEPILDSALVGGIELVTPNQSLDGSIRRKLTDLAEGAFL